MNLDPRSLLGWVHEPHLASGLHVLQTGGWESYDYVTLGRRVQGRAAQLTAEGLAAGDVVAICDPDCLGFVVSFFGVLYAGATPLPLPPRSADLEVLRDNIAGILRNARPAGLVAGSDIASLSRTAISRAGVQTRLIVLDDHVVDHWPQAPIPDVALLQFTSGSTGKPRGVRVTAENLVAQVKGLVRWQCCRPEDAYASWLPLHHDMGLAGLLLISVLTQADLWQMRPEQFIADPVEWLQCLDRGRASITAAPTFGYAYAARRVRPEQLEGLDLSGVRSTIVGAERLAPESLRGFMELLAPHGLPPRSMRPAYGLAEGTLAVTGTPISTPPSMVAVRWNEASSRPMVSLEPSQPLRSSSQNADSLLVSCGRAIEGTNVHIVDEDGNVLPDKHVGEISVTGPSVAAGYVGDAGATSTRFEGKTLRTGDAGFLADGELYVVGRIADSIKVRGRRIYAESIEGLIVAETAISAHGCLVVPGDHTRHDLIAILLEHPCAAEIAEHASDLARKMTGPAVSVAVYAVPRGTIARTTSGKVRRRHMWHQLIDGNLERYVITIPLPVPAPHTSNFGETRDDQHPHVRRP